VESLLSYKSSKSAYCEPEKKQNRKKNNNAALAGHDAAEIITFLEFVRLSVCSVPLASKRHIYSCSMEH